MSLSDFSLLQDLITGFYAIVCLNAPFRVSWWLIIGLLISALMGLIPYI